jgi:hypothetical protein
MTAGTRHRAYIRLALAFSWMATFAPSALAQPSAEQGAVYAYTDDRGALVHVQRLQDVPLNLRHAVRRVDLPEAAVAAGSPAGKLMDWLTAAPSGNVSAPQEPVMYGYRGGRGQVVYTNLATSVPLGQRDNARIDLRNVPLNSQLGVALNQQLEQRFQALRASDACSQLRSEAAQSLWERAWRDYRVLVVCGGALLLLLLATPWMHSRGWGAQWARVLFTAVPLLGVVAISASVLIKATAARGTLLPRAERCQPKAFASANGLPQRFGLVSALESEQHALAEIEREAPR